MPNENIVQAVRRKFADMASLKDGDYILIPRDGAVTVVCCDCALVHVVSIHHSTDRGVSVEFTRSDDLTEQARIARGVSDPLYVKGYDTGFADAKAGKPYPNQDE